MSDTRIETVAFTDRPAPTLPGRRALNHIIWWCMGLFWAAYGLCVAAFLVIRTFRNPRLPAGEVHLETSDPHVSYFAFFALVLAVLAGLAWRKWPLVKSPSTSPWRYAGFGLLAAIPLGLLLSLATPMEYVRDYAAYLDLGKSLYSTGDYSDTSDGNFTGTPDTLAWRPPGTSLLYGLPMHLGIPAQLSIWLVNSLIAAALLVFVSRSLPRDEDRGPSILVAAAGLLACLTALPLFLLPISHPPAMAIMAGLLFLVPTQSRLLARMGWSRWLLAGLLIGAGALFRANLVLLIGVLGAAILFAQAQSGNGRILQKAALAILLCVLGAAIAIGPWTARNWNVLHRFVPISTNGGMVFYSTNGSPHPSEQGRFIQSLSTQLFKDVPGEVDRDHEGWKRGKANILAHPAAFATSFAYRVPRLLSNPLYPISYIRDQARNASVVGMLPILEAGTVIAFWCLWGIMFVHWRAIRARILDMDRIAWPHVALLITVLISLLFENSPTFQQSFLPFLLFIWFDARKAARQV